jgi:hypothetical protein
MAGFVAITSHGSHCSYHTKGTSHGRICVATILLLLPYKGNQPWQDLCSDHSAVATIQREPAMAGFPVKQGSDANMSWSIYNLIMAFSLSAHLCGNYLLYQMHLRDGRSF